MSAAVERESQFFVSPRNLDICWNVVVPQGINRKCLESQELCDECPLGISLLSQF